MQISHGFIPILCSCAQGQLRAYFLKQAKPPMLRFRGPDPQGKEMCDEIAQLKITLDTLVRSQLFEVLEQA